MSLEVIVVLMFTSMLLLLLTGRQIFIIVGAVGTISALTLWGVGGHNMPFISGYAYFKWYVLLALPPFIFMGLVIAKSGVADNLFQLLYLWMGPVRGGLAIADVGLVSLIAMMSGLTICATVVGSTISLPQMLKRKYDKRLATGVVLAGGGLGFLIPPSIIFIIYGMIAHVSIGHLWVAGILPGFLLATMYIIYIAIICRMQPHLGPALPPEERVSWGEKFRALRFGVLPILLIVVVLGLLFMGVTSLIECAAIGAVGAMVLAAINRRLTWKMLREVADETTKLTSTFIWILVAAILFSAVFDGLGARHVMEHMLMAVGGGRWGIIAMMMASFFLMGMVLDDTAMLLIVAPLYIPLVADLGFSLVWYGVLYVVNCQMAYVTPPFGYNLFILKSILPTVAPDSGITTTDLYWSVIPFVVIQGACLAILIAFPQIALWLPSLVFGG